MRIRHLVRAFFSSPARTSARYRPHLEGLEERWMPSVTRLVPEPPTQQVTVMSRNLYLGADLDPVAAAVATGDSGQIVAAASAAWQQMIDTNFPERAEALADEIRQNRPLLVGLQEVSLFRTGAFLDPAAATHVEYDYLQILLDELDERGLHYAAVAVTQEFDIELPGVTANGPQDLRLTDRDVILARTDLPSWKFSLSNVQEHNFTYNVLLPVGDTGATVEFLRGWNSVDATLNGATFRFINTHLEAESPNPLVNYIQTLQAQELLAGPANTTLPVIMVGDFNSRADGTGTATYGILVGAGFDDAWTATHRHDPGNTWGHDADLRNPRPELTQRLDLVLYRGPVSAVRSHLVGEERRDRTSSGLWPSDHAGVVASLRIPAPIRHGRCDWGHHVRDVVPRWFDGLERFVSAINTLRAHERH